MLADQPPHRGPRHPNQRPRLSLVRSTRIRPKRHTSLPIRCPRTSHKPSFRVETSRSPSEPKRAMARNSVAKASGAPLPSTGALGPGRPRTLLYPLFTSYVAQIAATEDGTKGAVVVKRALTLFAAFAVAMAPTLGVFAQTEETVPPPAEEL